MDPNSKYKLVSTTYFAPPPKTTFADTFWCYITVAITMNFWFDPIPIYYICHLQTKVPIPNDDDDNDTTATPSQKKSTELLNKRTNFSIRELYCWAPSDTSIPVEGAFSPLTSLASVMFACIGVVFRMQMALTNYFLWIFCWCRMNLLLLATPIVACRCMAELLMPIIT